MKNLKLFINELAKLGLEISPTRWDENYYDERYIFSCDSLSSEDQQPVTLVLVISKGIVHLSICHGTSVIMRAIEYKINWDETSEDQVRRLASEFNEKVQILAVRAKALMASM